MPSGLTIDVPQEGALLLSKVALLRCQGEARRLQPLEHLLQVVQVLLVARTYR